MKAIVRVPASSANLGSGVDTLGIALSLYLTVTFETLPEDTPFGTSVCHYGRGFDGVTLSEEDNYVLAAAKMLYQKAHLPFPGFDLTIDTDIPFAHGLGSSSAALIAGLYGANAFLEKPLSQKELLTIANEMEGHPDNVVPAALGGFTLAMADEEGILYQSYPAADLTYIAAVPAYRLSTEKARAVLPKELSLKTSVAQLQRACFLVNAFVKAATSTESSREDFSVLSRLTDDRIFTPARRELMPGSKEACDAALAAGAYTSFTSGAGPTMLAIAPRMMDDASTKKVHSIGDAMKNAYTALNIDCEILYLKADNQGVLVEIQ